jgi:glycosyltransferase involved in cell wall biosynthesis
MTASIAALIPTRNRADLALAAVRSLLDQDCPIEIFLSDNSPSPEVALRDFCNDQKGVHYLRPSRELSMPEHWDWALGQVLERSQATHITVHYDRKVSKPGEWGALRSIASNRPDLLITFSADFVTIDPPPRRLWQPPWTGKLYSVTTARTAALVAAARINDVGQALPILSNCLIPRTILTRMAERFGDICNGTSGDAPFLCRFLTLDDGFLHYDRPIGIGYAPQRSAGFGYLRGEGGDFPDYLKTWGDRKWLERAPIPGINLGHNMLFHEYEVVREQTGDRLPPIDFEAYLRALAEALGQKTDAAERERLKQILESHGWSERLNPAPRPSTMTRIRYFGGRLLRQLRFGSGRSTGFSFRDDEEAIRFALEHPLTSMEHSLHLDAIEAVEVPA